MKKKIELVLNITAIIVVGILIVIQFLTEAEPIFLIMWSIVFLLQIIALVIRLCNPDKK